MGDWNRDYRSASMVGRNPERVRDAANAEIERLRNLIVSDAAMTCAREIAKDEEIERLRAALEKIEKTVAWGYPDRWETNPAEVRQIARAALEGKDG